MDMAVTELDRQVEAEEALRHRLADFAGEWVAVRDHQVVAHALTATALLEKVNAKEIEGIFQVPKDKDAACFF